MTNRWKAGAYGMTPTRTRSKPLAINGRRRPLGDHRRRVDVDLAEILSIDHACIGCATAEICCCARYEVCVDARELNQIIRFLPELARFCPRLKTANGYDNVFEEVEPGLYAIDQIDTGLCVFAFVSDQRIRCSLHTVGSSLGLPLSEIKPKACLLWPLIFTEGHELLSLDDEAFSFKCNSLREQPSIHLCSNLAEAIELTYGKGFRIQLEEEANKRVQRTTLPRRR